MSSSSSCDKDIEKELKRFPVLNDKGIFGGSEEDIDKEMRLELERQKIIEHESDKMMGNIVKRLKLKISRDNLFMDDITREELK